SSLFHVEDLASEREDRLRFRVAALNGGSTCRVTLDNEDFRQRGVFRLAVLELARHSAALEEPLAPCGFTSLPRGHSSGRSLERLADDFLSLCRVASKPVTKLIADDLLNECLGL